MKEKLKYLEYFLLSLFYTVVIKNCIKLFGCKDCRKLKHRISLCLIFKNEAPFLKEWIDYHRTIGIDHFYLYNNNSSDNYKDVLEDYINSGLVTLIEFPYDHAQMKAYEHCFENYKNDTNWIGFLDADEFLCPRYHTDINEWMAKFSKFHSVLIYFHVFGTGGSLMHDYSKNVIEQYYNCWPTIQNWGKSFVNTRFAISNYDSPKLHHSTSTFYNFIGFRISLPPINQFGAICPCPYVLGGLKGKMGNADIFLNHYFTKSWDVYKKKVKQTDVFYKNNPKKDYNYFFFHEEKCTIKDFTITRFLIRMKLLQNIID